MVSFFPSVHVKMNILALDSKGRRLKIIVIFFYFILAQFGVSVTLPSDWDGDGLGLRAQIGKRNRKNGKVY